MKLVNIYNNKREIYLFCRDDKGDLHIIKDSSYYPYYFDIDPKGEFTGFDGKKLTKIIVNEPNEVKQMRNPSSYEADIVYTKRYMIDKIDQIEKTNLKWMMIDIEVKHPEDEFPDPHTALYPISSITIYNFKYDKIRNWYLGDFMAKGLDIKKAEQKLFFEFITYMRKAKPDMLIAYYGKDFDFPYLFNRFPRVEIQDLLFEKQSSYNNFATAISPIGRVRGAGCREFPDVFYPAGISIIDYLEWIRKIYKGEKDESLDAIAEKYLGVGKQFKEVDFSQLSPEVKARNINDVELMRDLELKKFKLIPLYDEMRRLAMIGFEDFTYPLRIIDSLILREAKSQGIVLPSSNGEAHQEEEFEGAWRAVFQTGLNFNCGKYDISGAYPAAIMDLCIDIANLREAPEDGTIAVNITDRETNQIIKTCHLKQNINAVLPQIMFKLTDKKAQFKKAIKELNPETTEYKDAELKYEAVKVIVNAGWGVNGNRFFRYYNSDVASLITSTVRDVLHYLKDEVEKQGYKVIYTDTDGIFIQDDGKDFTEELNRLIQEWSKLRFNKSSTIKIEREGVFKDIFISTMCRYIGHLQKKSGVKEEVKGLQIKRRDSSNYTSAFQKELFDHIFRKDTQEQIVNWIKDETERIKTLPLIDISLPVKLGRRIEDYKTEVTNKHGKTYNKKPPIFCQAILNTQKQIPAFKKRLGEKFYWIYCCLNSEIIPLAFDEKTQKHIVDIAWAKVIQRNIEGILEPIFEGMGWENPFIPVKVRKPRKTASKQAKNEAQNNDNPENGTSLPPEKEEKIKPIEIKQDTTIQPYYSE